MKIFKKNTKIQTLTRNDAFYCTPIKSNVLEEKRLKNGDVLIIAKVKVKPLFAGMVKRFGGNENGDQEKKIQLDEMGTTTWDLMDGRRSVYKIIDSFANKYHIDKKEAEVAVTSFLRMLGKRDLIGLK